MAEKKVKKIETVPVKFETLTSWDFIAPGSFYIRTAGYIKMDDDTFADYLFLKTSDRAAAQKHVNDIYGKGKYTVIAAKIQKTVSRLESGGLSCTGTATRRGQKR